MIDGFGRATATWAGRPKHAGRRPLVAGPATRVATRKAAVLRSQRSSSAVIAVTLPAMHAAVLQRLPSGTETHVADMLGRFPLHVRLARPRRTKLGDHRPPSRGWSVHRITINDDLNPYAFMTTLLHEIAHAAAWERNRPLRRRIMPHGAEWKGAFAEVLAPVLHRGLLPADIEAALARTMLRPAAATCSDRGLALALARYDRLEPGRIRAEELAVGTWFRVDDGTVFRAGPVLRTRRRCTEARTGAEYVVHGLAKVEPLDGAEAQALGRRRSRRAVSGPAGRPGSRSGHSA